ncbi:protein-disulfide reductase DsbD N-terminal domain-containing protein [Mucilaginibacter ginkgonis]|uniref:Protein-disulfide reductase DsbD N-terminal domain-containing protein n=1 Tax=Mucilaginibacter ginkgonis TaxID=2682091 RepID=A0A6I4I1V1_9SPHI|nr:protein-disulfide reductase DsbD N-terminal domain-containing protein [Mucilaginibacter ginkgonis]QQL49285.1 protein-disulfide reductase DsbD N-terminal domain-containing protein [Mucilaginibacter ginkgonis]
MKRLLLVIVTMFLFGAAHAQILTPVKWSYAAKKTSATEATIFIRATIDNGWHIYSQTVKEGGPIKTDIKFKPSKSFKLVGPVTEPKPMSKFENAFKMNVTYFEKEVVFTQKVKLTAGNTTIKGQLEYMTCNDRQCLPPEDVDFTVAIK